MSIKESPGEKFDVKIGTKKEKLWTDVAREAENLIHQSEQNLIIQKEILKLAEKKIAAEKEKFK